MPRANEVAIVMFVLGDIEMGNIRVGDVGI